MLLDQIAVNQIAALILDFGFVGMFFVLVIWTLAKSPFSFSLQFHGGVEVGRNGYGKIKETSYSQTATETHRPTPKEDAKAGEDTRPPLEIVQGDGS